MKEKGRKGRKEKQEICQGKKWKKEFTGKRDMDKEFLRIPKF